MRLERYVVGVTWLDRPDQFRDDASGLAATETRERVAQLIGQLAATRDIELEYYDEQVIEVIQEEARSFEGAMRSLTAIAQSQGDMQLLRRIERASGQHEELERAKREASEAATAALAEKALADERIARLERQTTYLASTQDTTTDKLILLLHQVVIYAVHIDASIDRALEHATQVSAIAREIEAGEADLADAAAAIRTRNEKTVDDLDAIHLENDRIMAIVQLAPTAHFELEADKLTGDAIAFLDQYVNEVRPSRDPVCAIVFETQGISHITAFRPVDLVVVIDNLMDNSRKHGATQVTLTARRKNDPPVVEVLVSDDGRGLEEHKIDPSRIFEKGYTSSHGRGGSGLGLYHATVAMQQMQGDIRLDPDREPTRASFIITLPRESLNEP